MTGDQSSKLKKSMEDIINKNSINNVQVLESILNVLSEINNKLDNISINNSSNNIVNTNNLVNENKNKSVKKEKIFIPTIEDKVSKININENVKTENSDINNTINRLNDIIGDSNGK